MNSTLENPIRNNSMINIQKLAQDKQIILFDGVCNLCNGAINFVIDRDKKNVFHFASLQSDFGQAVLEKLGKSTKEFDSMILYKNGEVKTKSSAAIEIASQLSGVWKGFKIFWLVPKFLRDAVYSWIAKNRYRWFGKKNECRIPTPELQARFLG